MGALPPARRLETQGSAVRACGTSVPARDFIVTSEGAVTNVVVSWDGPPEPGPEKVLPSSVVDQRGCLYGPAVLAARVGSHVTVKNSDPLLHNVRATQSGRSLFNFAMPLTGMEVTRLLPAEPGSVELHCDVHPWMHGVVRTFAHSHFALTDAQGSFRLEGLPPGKQTLRFWHQVLGEKTLIVEVPHEGDAFAPDVVFEGAKKG